MSDVQAPVVWRNRIIETRMMDVSEILLNPHNWRMHNQFQEDALTEVLTEVGIADTLKAYYSEEMGGKLTLINGELRTKIGGLWPVDILDVNDKEARLLLNTFDAVTGLAGIDRASLDALSARTKIDWPERLPVTAVMLDQLAQKYPRAFTPETEPEASTAQVTDEDVEEAEGEMATRWDAVEDTQIELLCPHCGNAFYVNRGDI